MLKLARVWCSASLCVASPPLNIALKQVFQALKQLLGYHGMHLTVTQSPLCVVYVNMLQLALHRSVECMPQ